MDDRLKKALEFSNFMTTLNNQRRVIREQFLENCIHYLNGGKFSVTRELINFCSLMQSRGHANIVLIDDNNAPVEVSNLEKFLDDITDIYFTNSNEYLNKYNEIKKNRTVTGLVNL